MSLRGANPLAYRSSSPSPSPSPPQVWAEQMPWHHTMTVFDYPDAGLGGHNYCRNPTGRESGPWCYTTDYPDVEWEECDVGEPKK